MDRTLLYLVRFTLYLGIFLKMKDRNILRIIKIIVIYRPENSAERPSPASAARFPHLVDSKISR
jgi:hypothetical protein